MPDLTSMTRRRLATALFAAAIALPAHAAATQTATTGQDDKNAQDNAVATVPLVQVGPMLTVPAFAPLFATEEDARAFWDMLTRTYTSPAPDPRAVAKAFIKDRLGIDGDEYVVAHFATARTRIEGSADSVMVLTEALMEAFPEHSRHTFFGQLADTVGGLTSGGRESPGAPAFVESVFTCRTAGECFTRIGRFLWSRTGPGYIYNTFIGEGNVVDTVHEDMRALDAAFGIYPKVSTFLPENASPFLLSQVIGKFREEGIFSELPYIKRMRAGFDKYWATGKSEWPAVARYRFVHLARAARAHGVLTQDQYELVMKGGAPKVPLDGPITLQQLRNTPPDKAVTVRRFNINGYAATDLMRFIAADGAEVLYVPGAQSPFVVFGNEGELRQWVVRQARDRGTLDDLLSHFSIYDTQDGLLWTGVGQGLAHLADGRWAADSRSIDANNVFIPGDVFEDMRIQVEARLRDDARMRTSTAWDAWRTTLNRTATVLGPLGYAPPLAIPVQAGSALIGLGTGIEQGIDGKTTEERMNALEQAVMTVVTNASVATAIASSSLPPLLSAPAAAKPSSSSAAATVVPPETVSTTVPDSVPPRSADLRIAYSMGSVSPRWRSTTALFSSERSALEQATEVSETLIDPLPPLAGENPGRRLFDPVGTDPRMPFGLHEGDMQRVGYLVQTVPGNAEEWARRVIDLKKTDIDEARHRLDDFRTESLNTNRAGYQLSRDHSLVFRVDSRRPQELMRKGGFGPSGEFNDIDPMLLRPSTIGSGSLRGSNTVLVYWQAGFAPVAGNPTFHQYAIWTEGRPVASASDNHEESNYDSVLDEVHFPADVPTKNIYIIDSVDKNICQALARIYASPYVSTPYGVPLEAFTEYAAGRLNIDAPNKFTR